MLALDTLANHKENCDKVGYEQSANSDGDNGVESGAGTNVDQANESSDGGAEED